MPSRRGKHFMRPTWTSVRDRMGADRPISSDSTVFLIP
jgi:hypothetical protein